MDKMLVTVLTASFLVLIAGCSGEEKLDPRELADALSEEFTSELEFENGTEMGEPPPEEHAGDPNYPQIDPGGVSAPLMVVYDTWFDINLYSFFTPDTEVVGAVVHVEQANKTDASSRYIEVIPAPPALLNNTMTLRARVTSPSTRLGGNSFILHIALIRDDGAGLRGVGNYATMPLVTPPVAGMTPKVPQCHCSEFDVLGEITIVGDCANQELQSRLEFDCCYAFAEALLGYNSSFEAFDSLTNTMVDLPAGTRAIYQGPPDCTLQLNCP